jgi:hypothetical protein
MALPTPVANHRTSGDDARKHAWRRAAPHAVARNGPAAIIADRCDPRRIRGADSRRPYVRTVLENNVPRGGLKMPPPANRTASRGAPASHTCG